MRRITANYKSFLLDLIKSHFLWAFIALYSLYWLLSLMLPSAALIEGSSVLVLIGGLAVLISWFPSFLFGIATGAHIGSWQLPVAIVLTWIAITQQRTWSLFWRFYDQPDWMMNVHFLGQSNWIIFLASFLYLVSPGNETGEIPVRNWYLVIASVAIGMFAAGAVVTALLLNPSSV